MLKTFFIFLMLLIKFFVGFVERSMRVIATSFLLLLIISAIFIFSEAISDVMLPMRPGLSL